MHILDKRMPFKSALALDAPLHNAISLGGARSSLNASMLKNRYIDRKMTG